jgi:hypothetical protein
MGEMADDRARRRASQLAHLSDELELMAELLRDEARSMAEVAAIVARTSEQLIPVIADRLSAARQSN